MIEATCWRGNRAKNTRLRSSHALSFFASMSGKLAAVDCVNVKKKMSIYMRALRATVKSFWCQTKILCIYQRITFQWSLVRSEISMRSQQILNKYFHNPYAFLYANDYNWFHTFFFMYCVVNNKYDVLIVRFTNS